MVAIVEHTDLDDAGELALQGHGIRQIALVVVARVEHQRVLLDHAEQRLDVAHEPAELEHETAAAGEQILDGVGLGLHAVENEAAQPVILYAVGRAGAEAEQARRPFLRD